VTIIGDRKRLELGWEALNAFHHPQFLRFHDERVLAAGGVLQGAPSENDRPGFGGFCPASTLFELTAGAGKGERQ
jgi:hypothetical protein